MTPKDRKALWSWCGAGAGSMFIVAALARFIEPGGWVIWPTLGLLLVGFVSLLRMSSIIRRYW